MPERDLPSPWAKFLADVDQSIATKIEVHCLGGFVLTALYGIPRTTADLDYIATIPATGVAELQTVAGSESKLAKKYRVCFQHAGGVSDIPEDYQARLAPLSFGLSKLSLKVLEPYDLVLSKLTRNSPKDREDVKVLAGNLNLSFGILMTRFEQEMKAWLPNLQRHQLTLKLWREYFAE
jgi:hypothetical protein